MTRRISKEPSLSPLHLQNGRWGQNTAYSQANSPDVELSVLQVHGDSGDDSNILACRIQDINNMYVAHWNEDSSQLYKRVSGTWTMLNTTNDQIDDGSTVTLVCDGDSISFEDDGNTILSDT